MERFNCWVIDTNCIQKSVGLRTLICGGMKGNKWGEVRVTGDDKEVYEVRVRTEFRKRELQERRDL